MNLFVRDPPDRRQLVEENGTALSDYGELQALLASATSIASQLDTTPSTRKLLEVLRTAQKPAVGLGKFLSARIDTKYYNERRPEGSTIAQRVSSIPELVEIILDHADLVDVINMTQVSRNIKNIIDASTLLQLKLCLKAAGSASNTKQQHTTPFVISDTELVVDIESKTVKTYDRSSPFMVTTSADFMVVHNQELAKIGATWRRMFICQPPVKTMIYYLKYNEHGRNLMSRGAITAKHGVTIGDLYDEAMSRLGRSGGHYCGLDSLWDDSWDYERDDSPCRRGVEFLACEDSRGT